MLSKSYRTPGHLVFQVISKGKSFHNPCYVLKHLALDKVVLANDEQLTAKVYFSVLVSKKISKKATVRNLLKRRVSEAIKKALDSNKQNGFYAFMLKKEILKADFKQIYESVNKDLK
jgi:ribonuclease P protein component